MRLKDDQRALTSLRVLELESPLYNVLDRGSLQANYMVLVHRRLSPYLTVWIESRLP